MEYGPIGECEHVRQDEIDPRNKSKHADDTCIAHITDLGHEEPTLLLTNQLRRSARDLIVDCDLQLTLIASTSTDCWDSVLATAMKPPRADTSFAIWSTPPLK